MNLNLEDMLGYCNVPSLCNYDCISCKSSQASLVMCLATSQTLAGTPFPNLARIFRDRLLRDSSLEVASSSSGVTRVSRNFLRSIGLHMTLECIPNNVTVLLRLSGPSSWTYSPTPPTEEKLKSPRGLWEVSNTRA